MEVRARAPGKIILAGEHAVVHGSTAVAASIDLYTYASLHFPSPSGTYQTHSLTHFFKQTKSQIYAMRFMGLNKSGFAENGEIIKKPI